MSKLRILAVAILLLPAGAVMGKNLIANSGFDTGITGWNMVHTDDTAMGVTWLPTGGNPGGAVKLERTDLTIASNGHHYYYAIEVTPGVAYVLVGDWKGNIRGGGANRNWVEVFVGFGNNPVPATSDFGGIIYKKRWDAAEAETYNVNHATGAWDWEDIRESIEPGLPTIHRVATGNYMFVSFNLGGRADASYAYYTIDNIRVLACSAFPQYDLNGDCQVDFRDLAIMTGNWLNCNIDPVLSCWE